LGGGKHLSTGSGSVIHPKLQATTPTPRPVSEANSPKNDARASQGSSAMPALAGRLLLECLAFV